jgi:hypothetical protein
MDSVYWPILTLIGSFAGGYVGAYLTTKGKNLATHEDIHKLVDQVTAVTTATKKIEAEISSGVWDKQKRWEMKRDVLFLAAKAVTEVDDSLLSLATVFRFKEKEEALSAERLKSSKRWMDATINYDQTKLLVAVVCTKETKEAFDSFAAITAVMSQNITKGQWEAYDNARKDLALKFFALQAAVRKELEVDKAV